MDKLIKFVAEYTDGSYNFLVLQVGQIADVCSHQGCDERPTCLLYDVEGDSVPYCFDHAKSLDTDPDLEDWSKVNDISPQESIVAWIQNNPAMFIEIL